MPRLLIAGLTAALSVTPALAQTSAGAGDPSLGGPQIAGVCLLSQQAVFVNAKVGVAASARLQQLAKEAQSGIDAERTQVEADAQTLSAGRAGMKPEDFAAKQKALQDRAQALQQHTNLLSREIEATRAKAFVRIANEAKPVITKAYNDHKCGLLVDRNAVLGGNMGGDLTAAVVQGLDARITSITFDRETLAEPAPPASK